METNPPVGDLFRFGPFEVNLRTGELRKRGLRLSLQEQPFRILAALLDRPGEVVSREALCHRLWPDGTFVDFEHSLNAAVRRLRLTLGDDADTPRFIETVHRRGYRFLAWGPSLPLPAAGARAYPAPAGTTRPALRSRLAVLPFVSLSDEAQHLFFCDGLTEETVTQLARECPPHVGVIARTSVAQSIGTGQSAAEAGRALGADYLVEGSVRRDCDRVRIVVQLIEALEETHVWAAAFDNIAGDALTLQTAVAIQIARAVARALSARQPARSRVAAS